jgi:hypothetical protein
MDEDASPMPVVIPGECLYHQKSDFLLMYEEHLRR